MLKGLDQKLIMNIHELPSRDATYANFPSGLKEDLVRGLAVNGISKLYSHQAKAIEQILLGRNLIITTGTSSGKSLVYIVPAINCILNNSLSTVLYLSPAKALSQNQYQNIEKFCKKILWPVSAPVISVCDGDTPLEERREILNRSNIIFSTPDFWHSSGLSRHIHWPGFLSNLQLIIIDEAHIYRGSLGNHVSHVLRRLRRLCYHYGSYPRFILCSATIANALEFAENLTGLDFVLIDKEGSHSAKKNFVFINPPQYQDKNSSQIKRKLSHYEAARIVGNYVRTGRRVINFGRSKQVVESAYRKLIEEYPDIAGQVRPYKGTLTPETRREIEGKLFDGMLKGIISTNALELGVDIGDLDVCVMSGFPGSISSVWQQAGRVGRRGKESLVVFVAGDDPLDQYLIRKPEYFFSRLCEKAVVNPNNLSFLSEHLLAAAAELPIVVEDRKYWGNILDKAVLLLRGSGLIRLERIGEQKTYRLNCRMQAFSLRGDSPNYLIKTENGKIIGRTNYDDVLLLLYPGAIFLQMGRQYRVLRVEEKSKEVIAAECAFSWRNKRTRPSIRANVAIEQLEASSQVKDVRVNTGILTVKRQTEGFTLYEYRYGKGESKLSQHSVDLPAVDLKTVGIWLEIGSETVNRLGGDSLLLALHGVEHLLRVVLPWKVMCERNDIGAYIAGHGKDGATLFLYDIYPGGVGYCEAAFNMIEEILQESLSLIETCSCKKGCPSCIHLPQCEKRNSDLDKEATRDLLLLLLGRDTIKVSNWLDRTITAVGKAVNRADLRLSARQQEKGSQADLQVKVDRLAEILGKIDFDKTSLNYITDQDKLILSAVFVLQQQPYFFVSRDDLRSLCSKIAISDYVSRLNYLKKQGLIIRDNPPQLDTSTHRLLQSMEEVFMRGRV
ncbi:DEAD/DEAH box helicase domain protein [Desulfofarcimen acetoxidans DSM 771]|jgi:DEAD/DEAH box helicase domain-containing protein|uniref:DEAD/DEAH box helicase domain protein n=1 Tax=Desulfofarcimen acetoxidans (strain ATCC 49208 / DSM 771 / KCTC 5769 / VKM B-1644 / 5575) TaxID=485916 RepID=C8VVY4_DESAS|nr:DEAD/DEAH box helicase [Desulfofarcimen acetoxidans]ACV64271.1 DEAD/DEAH box helicase domain protein [Desulfofarcimen acetoxidans DSM 771]